MSKLKDLSTTLTHFWYVFIISIIYSPIALLLINAVQANWNISTFSSNIIVGLLSIVLIACLIALVTFSVMMIVKSVRVLANEKIDDQAPVILVLIGSISVTTGVASILGAILLIIGNVLLNKQIKELTN